MSEAARVPARREAHVRNKGARFLRLRLAHKASVFVGGYGALVHFRGTVELDGTDAGAVGIPVALVGEAVWRLQRPERGAHAPGPTTHPKQPAHYLVDLKTFLTSSLPTAST